MKWTLETADNGWIVSWDEDKGDGEWFLHNVVFEIPEEVDTTNEDPEALRELLYYVKERVCGQYYSKHKKRNLMIRYEGEEDDGS